MDGSTTGFPPQKTGWNFKQFQENQARGGLLRGVFGSNNWHLKMGFVGGMPLTNYTYSPEN